ncbi:MAG: CoA transferase [Chloroflexi bacterium]|nr:CoA transferase [Chloroflexota bacterium]
MAGFPPPPEGGGMMPPPSGGGAQGSSGTGPSKPLAGLKVIDMTSVVMGPVATRLLADYGATVIKLESAVRPDNIRTATPFKGGEADINRSGYFAAYNAGKLGLALNLQKPRGREFFRSYLVPWADVIVEAYSPGVLESWGLDYPHLKAIRPDLIMLRASLLGHTGPHASLKGFGQFTAALGGFYDLTGWPDREPAGPYSAYSDFISWNFSLVALLAALDYRRRTGRGQYIDQSLLESTLQFASHALLDLQANGHVATRQGDRDPYAAPHGVYRCRDRVKGEKREERWAAIAVTTDYQWAALCHAMACPELIRDPRFETARARLARQGELDALLEAWTSQRTPEEVMHLLQARGVPAGTVANARDLFEDPQLAHRGHFVTVSNSAMGPHAVPASSFHLSEAPGQPEWGAPSLGEHMEHICRALLGVPDDELAEYIAAEVLE